MRAKSKAWATRLTELREDSKSLAARFARLTAAAKGYGDIAPATVIEVWIDETERRTWFLFRAARRSDSTGH
jgi:starvation-inducible DNA-binding protein